MTNGANPPNQRFGPAVPARALRGARIGGGSSAPEPALDAPVAPRHHHVRPPDEPDRDVSEYRGRDAEHEAPEEERLPYPAELVEQPLQGNVDLQVDRRNIQHPSPELVRPVEHWRRRHRIADPHQRDGDGKVAPNRDCRARGEDHLERHRRPGHEQADGDRAGDRCPVEVPEVRIEE